MLHERLQPARQARPTCAYGANENPLTPALSDSTHAPSPASTPPAPQLPQVQEQALQALENPPPAPSPAAPPDPRRQAAAAAAVSSAPPAKPPAVGDKDYWKELASAVSKHFASPHSP